jgi:hypothetical protein
MARGRRRATVEYLEKLVGWAGGPRQFCALTDIQRSNLTAYLNSSKSISWKRLQRATEQVLAVPPAFVAIKEGQPYSAGTSLKFLPTTEGLYALFDSAMCLLYFGKAKNLRAEVRQTLGRKVGEVKPWTGGRNLTFKDVSSYISAYEVKRGDANFRHDVEALGLRLFVNNTYNRNHGAFKRRA